MKTGIIVFLGVGGILGVLVGTFLIAAWSIGDADVQGWSVTNQTSTAMQWLVNGQPFGIVGVHESIDFVYEDSRDVAEHVFKGYRWKPGREYEQQDLMFCMTLDDQELAKHSRMVDAKVNVIPGGFDEPIAPCPAS